MHSITTNNIKVNTQYPTSPHVTIIVLKDDILNVKLSNMIMYY